MNSRQKASLFEEWQVHANGCTCSRTSAFTLIELLLAITLTAMFTVFLATWTLNAGHLYRGSTSLLDRSSRARLVMDLLTQDFQTALIRQRDDETWLAIDVLSDSSNSGRWITAPGEKPGGDSLELSPQPNRDTDSIDPSDYRFGQAGMWLRFFCMPQDRDVFTQKSDTPGDINAVGWQIIRTRPSPGAPDDTAGYQLFRTVVRADRTFDEGYHIDQYKGSTSSGEPGELKKPGEDSLVCGQVVDMGVIVMQRNEGGKLVEGFPNRDTSLPPLANNKRYRAPQDGMPVRLDVYVRVLSQFGARELRAREQDHMEPDDWWHVVDRDGRIFMRSVNLKREL